MGESSFGPGRGLNETVEFLGTEHVEPTLQELMNACVRRFRMRVKSR